MKMHDFALASKWGGRGAKGLTPPGGLAAAAGLPWNESIAVGMVTRSTIETMAEEAAAEARLGRLAEAHEVAPLAAETEEPRGDLEPGLGKQFGDPPMAVRPAHLRPLAGLGSEHRPGSDRRRVGHA